MNATPSGPIRWMRAVRDARLTLAEKAVCYCLVTFADWKSGAARPSVASVAKGSGVDPRTVRKVYRRLRTLGVLSFTRESKGGRAANGRALVHELVLHLDVLESLNPARGSGLNADSQDAQPVPSMPPTGNGTPVNPAPECIQPGPTARQSTSEQPREQPPPTTDSGGGDGGGRVSLARGAEEPPSGSMPECDAEVYDRLISLGVSAGKARTLARSITIEEVEEAAKDATTPALIVHALQDGTARERLRVRREASEREAVWEAECEERRKLLESLGVWALNQGRTGDVDAIYRAWGGRMEALDGARVVTLAELRAAATAGNVGPAHILVDRLAEAAKGKAARTPGVAR